MNKRKH